MTGWDNPILSHSGAKALNLLYHNNKNYKVFERCYSINLYLPKEAHLETARWHSRGVPVGS